LSKIHVSVKNYYLPSPEIRKSMKRCQATHVKIWDFLLTHGFWTIDKYRFTFTSFIVSHRFIILINDILFYHWGRPSCAETRLRNVMYCIILIYETLYMFIDFDILLVLCLFPMFCILNLTTSLTTFVIKNKIKFSYSQIFAFKNTISRKSLNLTETIQ